MADVGGTVVRSILPSRWPSFAVAGVAGAVALGLIAGSDVMALVASLYGLEGSVGLRVPIGWSLHLLHGAVFAVGFGALTETDTLQDHRGRPGVSTALGLAYAGGLWVVGWSIVGPALLAVVTGFGEVSNVPVWDVEGLAGHVVYALAIGPARVAITRPSSERSAED